MKKKPLFFIYLFIFLTFYHEMQICKIFFNQKRFHIDLNLVFIIYLSEKNFSKAIKKFDNPIYKTNLKRGVSKSNIFNKTFVFSQNRNFLK